MIKLKDLLKEGESETVEFKPSLSQMDKITESISAFSNTKGGTVVIGVSDKGEVLGVNIGKNTIESLANQIKQNTDPMALFEHISGAFVVTFRLPPVVEDLEKMGLNIRQINAMNYIIKKGSINNKEYISLNSISRKTATTDLKQLVLKGLLTRVGEGKRKIQYVLPDYAKITQKITQKGS